VLTGSRESLEDCVLTGSRESKKRFLSLSSVSTYSSRFRRAALSTKFVVPCKSAETASAHGLATG
jgi:hypothetical protein